MEDKLIETFSLLSNNEKRNQVNSELEKLAVLLENVHKQCSIEKLPSSIGVYNKAEDYNMSDDEYLKLIYENIIYIRKDILTLVNKILNGNL